jgi:hypothetical protein
MGILAYLEKNYHIDNMKDLESMIYDGYGPRWGVDKNGKRFEKIDKSSLRYTGCGCPWFDFDGQRFDCINIGRRSAQSCTAADYKNNLESVHDDNCSGDSFLDAATDPSEPLNPLNPFSPFSIFNDND